MPSFTALRAADFDAEIRSAFAADPNGGVIEEGRGDVLDVLVVLVSLKLGELGEALQSLNDQLDPDNAQGVQLDIIGALRGVPRNQPSYSTATVTLTGTAGTIIPQGKVVEGGGDDGAARWVLTADATIGGGGTTTATVQAQEAGAVVALATEIDTIVTPVTGWTVVSNAAAATTGQARELDDDYRIRQPESMQLAGTTTAGAIRAALNDLDFVDKAIVVENDTGSSATVGGLTLDPNSIYVIIDPAGLTTAQKQSVAAVLYARVPSGIKTMGTDNSVTVTGEDDLSKTLNWDEVSDLAVTVAVTVVLDTGYVLADVETAVQDAVAAYFDEVAVGEEVTDDDLKAGRDNLEDTTAIMRVTGVKRVSALTLNGAALVTPNLDQRPTLSGSATVTT